MPSISVEICPELLEKDLYNRLHETEMLEKGGKIAFLWARVSELS